MRAEHSLPSAAPKDVFKVNVWKTKPDAGAPWWQRWFHRYAYLPFQNFSITWMNIPPAKQVIVESDEKGNVRKTFCWFEDIGIYEHEDQADIACLTESDFYTRLPYGRRMPEQSAQYEYGAPTFPRRNNPREWHRPVLSLIIKDRREEEREKQVLAEYLSKISQLQ